MSARPDFHEPDDGDTEQSGIAIVLGRVSVSYVLSCENCAKVLGLDWMESPTGGECNACGVGLIP